MINLNITESISNKSTYLNRLQSVQYMAPTDECGKPLTRTCLPCMHFAMLKMIDGVFLISPSACSEDLLCMTEYCDLTSQLSKIFST